jgi:tetratricopeptide (TPR) repeat protein
MDNPNVGTIILHRLGNVEGFTTSITSALAPKDAKKAFDKGRENARKKKWDDAQKEFEKAVGLYPKYAVAWADLGRVYEQKDDIPNARKAYEQALAADSKLVTPYVQIAGIQAREAKWQEVAETTDSLIRLNPINYPIAYFYNSIANVNLQKFDAAEKSALEAKRLAPNMAKIDHVLGVIYANKNDFEGAARHMKAYIAAAPNAGDIDVVKKQLAEVEKTLGARGGAAAQQP